MRHAVLLFLTLFLTAAIAQAQEVPKRKSGLWELKRTTVRTDGKERIVQMCIDQASDNALRQLAEGMRNESCKTDKVTRDGERMTIDAVCTLGRSQVVAKTHAVISGNFESAYKIESKSTYDPPMRGRTEGNTVLEARWLGACKAGQKPGDYILSSGVKLRMGDADKGAEQKQPAPPAAQAPPKEKRKGNYMPVQPK
jgi:hypothetical protein